MLQPTLENKNKMKSMVSKVMVLDTQSDLFDILDGSIGSAMKIYIDL